jgi:hypothetical protein
LLRVYKRKPTVIRDLTVCVVMVPICCVFLLLWLSAGKMLIHEWVSPICRIQAGKIYCDLRPRRPFVQLATTVPLESVSCCPDSLRPSVGSKLVSHRLGSGLVLAFARFFRCTHQGPASRVCSGEHCMPFAIHQSRHHRTLRRSLNHRQLIFKLSREPYVTCAHVVPFLQLATTLPLESVACCPDSPRPSAGRMLVSHRLGSGLVLAFARFFRCAQRSRKPGL